MRLHKIRIILWRWHGRMGLIAAVFVLLLSGTGLLLNHSASIGLDRTYLKGILVLALYQLEAPDMLSYTMGDDRVSQIGGRELYLNHEALTYCDGQLRGAHSSSANQWRAGQLIVACEKEILQFNAESELIERIGDLYGLPSPVSRLGLCEESLCIQSLEAIYQIDLDQLTWVKVADMQVNWSQQNLPQSPLYENILDQHLGQNITWERLLLDLHSGRILGRWGVYLMDVMAVLFIILSASGVLIWSLKKRKR